MSKGGGRLFLEEPFIGATMDRCTAQGISFVSIKILLALKTPFQSFFYQLNHNLILLEEYVWPQQKCKLNRKKQQHQRSFF